MAAMGARTSSAAAHACIGAMAEITACQENIGTTPVRLLAEHRLLRDH